MKLLKCKIDDLKHDPNNARRHSARNLTAVKNSLERFGQQKPIVVLKDKTVIAGNATLQSARDLGWTHIETVVFDGTADEAMAFALADNRTAELANWDWAVLGNQLDHFGNTDTIDLNDIGWTLEEVSTIVGTADFDLVPDDELEKAKPKEQDEQTKKLTVTVYKPEEVDAIKAAIESALADLPATLK